HLPLRDDGNDAQGPALTPRTRDHLQAKDPLQQPRPAPARRRGARSRLVEALLAWCREDRPTQMAVWRQAPAIAHEMDVWQGPQRRQLLQEFHRGEPNPRRPI